MIPNPLLRMLPPALLLDELDERDRRTPPLLAVLGALQEQYLMLAERIDALVDDAFPDSAADWALPYLAELLGLPPDASREEIAYATALRRRTGTPTAVEDHAEVITGWPARVQEGWQSTLWVQQLRHPRRRTASISLRTGEHLLIGSGLDPARRSVTPGGPHHPAAVTARVHPWRVHALTDVQAAPLGDGRLAMHPLGIAAPLYLRPRPLRVATDAEDEREPGRPPAARPPRSPAELPIRATWRVLGALGEVSFGPVTTLSADHPAAGPRWFTLTVDRVPVPWDRIGLAALPDGTAVPAPGHVLVDPSRGVLLPADDLSGIVRTTFHRAASGLLGPPASRSQPREDAGVVVVVDPDPVGTPPVGQTVVPTLEAAVAVAMAATGPLAPDGAPEVEIRLQTSDRLAAPPPVTGSPALTRWRLVAPSGLTPTIVGDLAVDLDGGRLEVLGCYLTGSLRIGPGMREVVLDGVTQDTTSGAGISLDQTAWTTALTARRCVLGSVRADQSALPVTLTDCLVDGRGAAPRPCGGDPGGDPSRPALAAVDRFPPDLVATGTTFVGVVAADEVWVSDCLFTDGLRTTITATGCVRFCHLGPEDDPTAHPLGHRCLTGHLPRFGGIGLESAGHWAPALPLGTRSGHPLLTGAGDGGEIGAYHHARRGPLARRLSERLTEMIPLTVHGHVAVTRTED